MPATEPRTRTTHRLAGVGNRLRRLRNLAGVRSGQLARAVGVDPSMISHWESERAQIRIADAIKAVDYLGATLDALARGPAELLPANKRRAGFGAR